MNNALPTFYRLSERSIRSLSFTLCSDGAHPLSLNRPSDRAASTLIDFQLVKMRSDVYSQLISLRGDRSLTGYSPSRFSALTNSNLAAEGKMEEWEVALVSLTIPSAIKSYWDVAPENRKIVLQ